MFFELLPNPRQSNEICCCFKRKEYEDIVMDVTGLWYDACHYEEEKDFAHTTIGRLFKTSSIHFKISVCYCSCKLTVVRLIYWYYSGKLTRFWF